MKARTLTTAEGSTVTVTDPRGYTRPQAPLLAVRDTDGKVVTVALDAGSLAVLVQTLQEQSRG